MNETPKPGNVIVILSAGLYDSGHLDFETISRLTKGVSLYRAGFADKIICSGGVKIEKSQKSIAEIMKETLIVYGVPREAVLIQDETINTYNDVSYIIRKFGKDYDLNKSIFVTSEYHTFRLKSILRNKSIDACVLSAGPYMSNPRFWSERMTVFREVVREYLAICYFKAKGWI